MTKRRRRQFEGYQSQKPQYFRELWNAGPVQSEARRLAWDDLAKEIRAKGQNPDLLSNVMRDNAVTVLLLNSEDHYLSRAKFNLEYRRYRK